MQIYIFFVNMAVLWRLFLFLLIKMTLIYNKVKGVWECFLVVVGVEVCRSADMCICLYSCHSNPLQLFTLLHSCYS